MKLGSIFILKKYFIQKKVLKGKIKENNTVYGLKKIFNRMLSELFQRLIIEILGKYQVYFFMDNFIFIPELILQPLIQLMLHNPCFIFCTSYRSQDSTFFIQILG